MSEVNLSMPSTRNSVFTKMNEGGALTTEVSEEFSLPDYVPEVRRVLLCRASVLPESKFIADSDKGSSVEIGGSVSYMVIYTDDEGNLCSTPLSSSYEGKTSLSSRPSMVFVDTVAENVNLRATAPRKLTIKSRLKSKLYSCEVNEYSECIQGKSSADELFIERQKMKVDALGVKSAVLQGIGISEKLDTPACESLRPIWCDAGVVIKSSTPKGDYIEVSGDVYVKCVCECDGEISTFTKIMPIYEDVECSGVTDSSLVSARGRCVSLTISSEENDNSSSLFFDVQCEIECEAYEKLENEVTLDCYSTKCELDASYKSMDTFYPVSSFNRSFSVSESVKRKSKEICEIIDTFLDVSCEKLENKNGRLSVLGAIKATIIGKGEPGEDMRCEYLCESVDVPFKYDTDIPYSKDMLTRVSLNAPLMNARISDDKLLINGEAYIALSAISKSNEKILDSAVLKHDNEFKVDNTIVRVFFPQKDDTLWDVAKKYHVRASDIIEKNSLDSDSLNGITHLII